MNRFMLACIKRLYGLVNCNRMKADDPESEVSGHDVHDAGVITAAAHNDQESRRSKSF